MRKISTTVSESGDNIETAQVGSNYKTSNLPDLYSGAPPNVKNYTNKGYIKETADSRGEKQLQNFRSSQCIPCNSF